MLEKTLSLHEQFKKIKLGECVRSFDLCKVNLIFILHLIPPRFVGLNIRDTIT